jgi:hypothetical protein
MGIVRRGVAGEGQVASRKRLLFKVRVRAGKASATAYKRLKLIRR